MKLLWHHLLFPTQFWVLMCTLNFHLSTMNWLWLQYTKSSTQEVIPLIQCNYNYHDWTLVWNLMQVGSMRTLRSTAKNAAALHSTLSTPNGWDISSYIEIICYPCTGQGVCGTKQGGTSMRSHTQHWGGGIRSVGQKKISDPSNFLAICCHWHHGELK